jgi:hypothetical protein
MKNKGSDTLSLQDALHNHFDLSPGLYDSATPDATCGAGTAYPSGARDFTPIFSVFRVVFCVVFRN